MTPADASSAIARRYDRLAPIYRHRVFDLLFAAPPGIRRRAAEALALEPGHRVLDVGCGTGLALPFLLEAVGPDGHVFGVDLSSGMLTYARRRFRASQNLSLTCGDAATVPLPEDLDAAIFNLSFSVMGDRHAVLARVWAALRPGGTLVVMDAGTFTPALRRTLRPWGAALSRVTVLGDPDVRPWDDLRAHTADVEHRLLRFGTYSITRAVKGPAIGAT